MTYYFWCFLYLLKFESAARLHHHIVCSESEFCLSVGNFSFIDDNIVANQVLVQLLKFSAEVQPTCLVFLYLFKVCLIAHLAVVAAVEFEHVTQGLLSLNLFCEEKKKS